MKKNNKANNIAKAIIIFIISIIIIIIAVVLVVSSGSGNKSKNSETTETGVMALKDLYDKMSTTEDNLDITYKYLVSTDSIQVVLNDIQSDSSKNVFVVKNKSTNELFLRNTNDTELTSSDSIYFLALSEQMDLNYIYNQIIKAITEYHNSIPEDAGDAKDYGEDATITKNPDGSLGIKKD